MDTITLTIDDVEVRVEKAVSVLEAAQSVGIYIPALCAHPDLDPAPLPKPPVDFIYWAGRLVESAGPPAEAYECGLCLVEIEGREELELACYTFVREGMVVHTNTPRVQEARCDNLVVLMSTHPHACLTCAQREGCSLTQCSSNVPENERCCPKFYNCELRKVAEYIGIRMDTPRYIFHDLPVVTAQPLFEWNYNLCIGCTRCVRVCRDLRGVEALGFVYGEDGEVIVGTVGPTLKESGCRFCGACVEVCPTGALTDKGIKEAKREEALVPCKNACPIGIDVPRYVRLIAERKFGEALAVVREKTPLPSVCSLICLRFCEDKCRRGEVSEPIAIRALKRFVSDNHSDLWKERLKAPTPSGKKVAIIGSGPAGLTAGYYLARCGHEVTIFEASLAPGGMLRNTISKKRLPPKVLKRDIDEILQMGVNLQLNTRKTSVDELFEEGFDAVFLAMGSTYVGAPAFSGKDGIKLTPWGSIAVDPRTLATSQKGVFAGGDAVLGGIAEDFIQYTAEHWDEVSQGDKHFLDILIDQIVLHRGDASRSAIRAIAAGRQAASSIDSYLGGDGVIDETLVEPEDPNPFLGYIEGFADWSCLSEPYQPPPPQLAGLGEAEPPLDEEAAVAEAKRCLQCDLRFKISPVMLPPEKWLEFNAENVGAVPEIDGVYQLLDEGKTIIYIKGTMNLHQELEEQLSTYEKACYFGYEEEPMYTKRESELIQQFLQQYSKMPEGNDELADLF